MARPLKIVLTTSGGAFGPLRVRLGLSLRDLQVRSGVAHGLLSMMESGRMFPTADEWEKIHHALADSEAAKKAAAVE
jgi:predicted transcriptional regulator